MLGGRMEISLVVMSLLSLSFAIAYYISQKRLSIMKQAAMKLILESESISAKDIDIDRENFIKFLSESREWAFEYIEQVQDGLKKFIKEVEPQIEYYNKYGMVIDGMVPPHDFALKKISKEFEDLKRLLPEETDDKR
jgi:hypothetical protein